MMTGLNADDAWQALREARDGADPGGLAGGRLRLDKTGWQAYQPVDDPARALLDCLTPLVMQPGRLAIAQLGLRRVLIEGGGVTVSRFLEAGVLHRLHLLLAPLLIGSGRPGLAMAPIATLDEARRPLARTFRCGDDTLFDLDLTRS
ncbi:dihydrofolate reductase family protein [Halomonas sp.]|uniref:dihydrofolate reductase family protein n=1 Tax=Halomonas sp. TaxID=1486246 RepID=UPI003561A5E0